MGQASDYFTRKAVKVRVLHTSNLKANTNVVHPFVRMHLVSLKTGVYLQKADYQLISSINANSVYQSEQATTLQNVPGGKQRCETRSLDFIPPFATNACDLRAIGKSRAEWYEDIIVNADLERLVDNDVLLLFELLDFSPFLLVENPAELSREGFFRVAWGYLRLAGLSQYHVGQSKVQLHNYIFDTRKYEKTRTAANNLYNTPDVYFDFVWPLKSKYEGYLAIDFLPEACPESKRIYPKDPLSVFEEEEGIDQEKRGPREVGMSTMLIREERQEQDKSKQLRLMRMTRFSSENAKVPDEHLYKFKTDRMGCNTLAFSPDGRLLAASVTHHNSRTWIHIYDVEEGELMCKISGHKNIVHDFSWAKIGEFQYLLSSSSDMSATVASPDQLWKIPDSINAEKTAEEVYRETHHLDLFHPSFVYTGKILPEKYDGTRLITMTGCFDGKVRIFYAPLDTVDAVQRNAEAECLWSGYLQVDDNRDSEELIDMRHPNAITIGERSTIFIGDNKGTVHIWEMTVPPLHPERQKPRSADQQAGLHQQRRGPRRHHQQHPPAIHGEDAVQSPGAHSRQLHPETELR